MPITIKPKQLNNLRLPIYILSVLISGFLFAACASQLPPSGGDDDIIPPEVIRISPAPNTVNFSGNTISIEFDEHVDRRSFEESLFISPRPREVRVNYGGNDVEIEFPGGLEANRTYTFTVGRDLKDIRGGNKITQPIQFAISTGSVIDRGRISGNVFTDKVDRLIILGYIVAGNSSSIDPSKQRADFITQADEKGTYSFLNLPRGTFRLFAVRDSDRNLLYDADFDEISVASRDYTITDTNSVSVDFLMRNLSIAPTGAGFIDSLKSIDTANFIHSSVSEGERGVSPSNRFYFYFRGNRLSRTAIADNLALTDTSGAAIRIVYNWLSDSLLQVFPQVPMPLSANLKFTFDFRNTAALYYNTLGFKVIEESNLGKISGLINPGEYAGSPVYITLYDNANMYREFTQRVENDSAFTFTAIPEGSYTLFSYIDRDGNGIFDRGTAFPFKPSEPFIVYPSAIDVRGSWSIDNVMLRY
jgi:uncharacterized protein (DUF2141 family)